MKNSLHTYMLNKHTYHTNMLVYMNSTDKHIIGILDKTLFRLDSLHGIALSLTCIYGMYLSIYCTCIFHMISVLYLNSRWLSNGRSS